MRRRYGGGPESPVFFFYPFLIEPRLPVANLYRRFAHAKTIVFRESITTKS